MYAFLVQLLEYLLLSSLLSTFMKPHASTFYLSCKKLRVVPPHMHWCKLCWLYIDLLSSWVALGCISSRDLKLGHSVPEWPMWHGIELWRTENHQIIGVTSLSPWNGRVSRYGTGHGWITRVARTKMDQNDRGSTNQQAHNPKHGFSGTKLFSRQRWKSQPKITHQYTRPL